MAKTSPKTSTPKARKTLRKRSSAARTGSVASDPGPAGPDDVEEAAQLEDGLSLRDHLRHQAPGDDPLSDETSHAAEALPADVPVDKADQTDRRVEVPPAEAGLETQESQVESAQGLEAEVRGEPAPAGPPRKAAEADSGAGTGGKASTGRRGVRGGKRRQARAGRQAPTH